MKVLIHGFGMIAEEAHLPTFREEGLDVVGAVDVTEERRGAAERQGLESFSSLNEALEATEPELVDLALPPAFKLKAAREAASRGVDILVEKPICLPGEQEDFAEACRGVSVTPVHNYLHAPHFRALKEAAGDASEVHFEVERTGFCESSEAWRPGWRTDPDISGGGILMDHGYHAIYLSSYLAGEPVEAVELLDMEVDEGVDFETRFRLKLGEAASEVFLTWNGEGRRIEVEADGRRLLDDRIEGGEVFDSGLSDGSTHREWFRGVVETVNGGGGDGSYGLGAALEAMEVIEELYRQAEIY